MINPKFTTAAILCASMLLLVTACARFDAASGMETEASPISSGTPTSAPTDEQSPLSEPTATEQAQASPLAPGAMPTKEILMPPTTARPGAAASVPQDLLALMISDAARKAGIDPSEVEVMSAQEVTWSDGSLGCPKPGVMYTQALVPGYQVILKAGASQYTYHAAQSGSFVECKPSLKAPRSLKPPNSPGDPTR
jgi:hypothetical protein